MLPEELRPFFWDVDFEALRWSEYRDFIITRILSRGDWPSIIWVRQFAGDTTIRSTITRLRGRDLSPQQLRFWELIVKLPHRVVTGWINDPAGRVWNHRRHA
jgi:hypothetical protein